MPGDAGAMTDLARKGRVSDAKQIKIRAIDPRQHHRATGEDGGISADPKGPNRGRRQSPEGRIDLRPWRYSDQEHSTPTFERKRFEETFSGILQELVS